MVDWIETILSKPDEWWSLFVGLIGILVLIYVTDDLVEAILGSVVIVIIGAAFLPVQITAEWHYWGGAILVMLVLGLYEIGPKNPGE